MIVPSIELEVVYNGTNISGAIEPFITSLSVIDKAKSESDELEIILEDSERLWHHSWYPTKGDSLNVKITQLGMPLNCGTFVVDETSASGSSSGGTTSTIKALATGINHPVRSLQNYAHENKTLKAIAQFIASKHNLKLVGTIENIEIERETQYRESDLTFLSRLAESYGYIFTIKGSQLVFSDIFSLENDLSSYSLKPEDMVSWSFTDKTSQTYKAVKVEFHDPEKKEVIRTETKETNPAFEKTKSDTLVLNSRVENSQQAQRKAKSALYKANSLQQQGNIQIPGNVKFLAGINIDLLDMGVYSGKYHITQATISLSPSNGFVTDLEVKRIGLRDKQ